MTLTERAESASAEQQPLRHNLWAFENGWRYGPWHIHPADWIRPHPSVDWDWWHDSAEDQGPGGSAANRDAFIAAIHEWEDEQ